MRARVVSQWCLDGGDPNEEINEDCVFCDRYTNKTEFIGQ